MPTTGAPPVPDEAARAEPAPPAPLRASPSGGVRWRAHGATLLIVGACTAIAALMERHFDPANLTMIYLLGVVVSAVAFGRGPAIAAAVLSVAAFDFLFVPPRFTFSVSDTQYLVTFAVMLVVAIVIGTLTAWLREQREAARLRERWTAALHRLSRDLALRSTTTDVTEAAAGRIAEVMAARVAIALMQPDGTPRVVAGDPSVLGGREQDEARRACENAQPVGLDSPGLSRLHLPLEAGVTVLGVLSVHASEADRPAGRERFHLLRALASQTALAIERCRLAEDMERVRLQAEAERTRSALLSSVSHDLRTPLAAITGAASSLREGTSALSPATRQELADTIADEAARLNRLIGNLLDMTRLGSGTPAVRKDWHSVEEVVGAALTRLEPILGKRPLRLDLPADLPLVPLDDVLFAQVVWNLVENAVKYAPPDAAIEIRARLEGQSLRLEVADRGPGFEPGEERKVFEKFYRGARAAGRPGAGLGLAICQAIVSAHGGTIEARDRPGGGAVFTIVLPLEGAPPSLEAEPPPRERSSAP